MKSESLVEIQRRFLAYAAPTCMLIVSPFGLSFVTIMFAGRQSKELLSGVALGNTTYNIFIMSLMCGFCSLLSTYGPQVYGNPATRRQLGTVVQKVFLLGLAAYLVVLAPYLSSLRLIRWVLETVTGLLRAHDLVASDSSLVNFDDIQDTAQRYMDSTWSWALLDFTMRLVTKYLSLQYHSTAVYTCTGLLIVLHTALTYLFTCYLGLELQGLVIGGTLSRVISLAALVGYCIVRRHRLAWTGLTTRVLNNWREMVVLGLSASVNVFSEMGMYELAIFLAQFRGVDYLATVVISFQVITLIYSSTYGVCYAAAALIGTALGEGSEDKVKRYMRICLANTVVESVALAVAGYLLRYRLAALFTSDPGVVQATGDMLWILLVEVPLDHLQTLFSYGILVTVGCQVFVASALATICYGICTPILAALIFFTPLNGIGVLYGMLLFVGLSTVVCGLKILSLDLAREIECVQERVQSSIRQAGRREEEEEEEDEEGTCLIKEDDTDESLLEAGAFLEDIIYTSKGERAGGGGGAASALLSRTDLKENWGKVVMILGLTVGWMSVAVANYVAYFV